MTINLINNIAFLIALLAAGQVVFSQLPEDTLKRQVLFGLLFGGAAVLAMANPVSISPGIIFDGRSIVLAVAGVAGGWVTAVIAAGMAAVYRYQLGGVGVTLGVMVVLFSALLGAMARQWWLRRAKLPRPIDYLALGLVVQLMQLAALTQASNRVGYAFIEQTWWVLLLIYPLATMLLCLMFRNFERQAIDKAALQSTRDKLVAEQRANKHRLTAVMENLTEGLVIADQQGATTYWNPQALAINGFASMADCERPLAEFAQLFEFRPLNEDRLLPVEEWPMSRVLRGEELHDWEIRLRRLDQGWEKVLTYSGWLIHGADDETLAFLSIIEITDRKESETKYRTLFESMVEQVHFWKLVRDEQGNIKTWRLVDANPVSLESWKRTRAQTVGKTADEIWPNSNAIELFMPIVKKIFEEGIPHRWESYFAETNQTLAMTSVAFGEYFFSTGLDITERRQAEQALQDSEERYRSLVEMTFDWVWEVDTQGRYTYANSRMSTILGYQPDEVLGRTPFDFMPADEAERVEKLFEGIMAARQTFSMLENTNHHRDGGLVFLETSGAPILSPEGTLLGYRGVDRDITQRKNAELQLVRDNILLKTQQELSPDGILIVDENDNIISFNQNFCKIWEIPDHVMAEQSSENAMEYVLPRLINPDEFVKRIRDLYRDKKASSFEEIALTNGKILARHSSPMFGSDAQYYGRVWFYRDITERKQAEVELRAKVDALRASYAELEQFNRAMVDRELRMIELKQEINDLCRRLGEPPRHAMGQFQTGHISGAGPAPGLPSGGDA